MKISDYNLRISIIILNYSYYLSYVYFFFSNKFVVTWHIDFQNRLMLQDRRGDERRETIQ